MMVSMGALALSLVSLSNPQAYNSLVLLPGNSLLLGDHNVWSFVTCSFVSHSLTLLALHAGLVYMLGLKFEGGAAGGGGPHPSSKVVTTFALALGLSGLLVYLVRVTLYMGSGNEDYLYKPVAGCGPLAVVAGVLAVEVFGDASLHTAVALPVSQVPLGVIVLSSVLQNSGLASDSTTSLLAGLVAWTYLRFFAAHGGPGSPLGDPREEFELLVFVPGPLRVALRPLEKLASSILLPIIHQLVGMLGGGAPLLPAGAGGLPFAVGTVEGGNPLPPLFGVPAGGVGGGGGSGGAGGMMMSLAGVSGVAGMMGGVGGGLLPGGGGGAGGGGADPIADRRRIKALASLDKRLAEIKAQLAGGGQAPSPTSAPSPPSTSDSPAP